MAEKSKDAKDNCIKPPKGRSPAFPYIPLGEALERIKELLAQEGGRHPFPPTSAFKAWNLSEKSSGARQTLAALKHFGLVEYSGLGENRQVKISELAWNISMDKREDTTEKDNLIKIAAFKPAIHSQLWKLYDGSLPSDLTIETYLVKDRKFNAKGAKDFIVGFKATIAFAKLKKSDKLFTGDDAETPDDPEDLPPDPGTGEKPKKKERKGMNGEWAKEFSWPLSDGTTAELVISGARPGKDEISALEDYFKIAKRVLEKIAASPQDADHEEPDKE